MTQVEWTMRLIEYGYFNFCGVGTDRIAALNALESASRIDTGLTDMPILDRLGQSGSVPPVRDT